MSSRAAIHAFWTFGDTGGYAALLNRRDQRHADATALYARLRTEHWRLFTTNFILAETHALLLAKADRRLARQALATIQASAATTIIRVSAADEVRAVAILDQYVDKSWSYTDCTSFAVMERLGIAVAFSFDRNFSQYGWTVLSASRR